MITSIENKGSELYINNSITLKKVRISKFIYQLERLYVRKAKVWRIWFKMLGKVAGVVGTGAAAVGLGSGSAEVLQGAGKCGWGKGGTYGADAIDKIGDLPISEKKQKIAGKKMKIIGWGAYG